MRVVYDGLISSEDRRRIKEISSACGILFDTARLLYCRKIDTVEKAKAFLSSGKKDFNDPFLLDGMSDAVKRIYSAKEKNQNILIFGDYDADGICATSVLYYCLKDFGITAEFCVPEREEGYGLNLEKIVALNEKKKIDLIITVDCGISECENIEKIKELGIDIIVTDHHVPPEILPDTVKIDPKIEGQSYPFSELCGAGVAYKLGYALIGIKANKYLDFVALATVADSMDLVGENRSLVIEGLKIFNSNALRPCFLYLLGDNVNNITAQTLAFNVAPKINAGGRMGDALSSLILFTTESNGLAAELAEKLKAYNSNRQIEGDLIFKEAREKIIKENACRDDVIMVYDKKWRTGFIGIVAAKLVEEFSRPVIVFGASGEFLKGSARSVDGVNIFDAINYGKDLLEAFGGHAQAAGVTVKEENFIEFKNKVNYFISELYGKQDYEKKVHAEWNFEGEFSERFAKEIEMLEPFGTGNRRPCFTTEVYKVDVKPLKFGSTHYGFSTSTIEMLNFNGEENVKLLSFPIKKKIVFEASLSSFRNKTSLRGIVKNIIVLRQAESDVENYAFSNALKGLKDCDTVKNVLPYSSKLYDKAEYLIYNLANLSNYPMLSNLPISCFTALKDNAQSQIVAFPDRVSEKFEKTVYLDKPLSFYKSDKPSYCNYNLNAFSGLYGITCDRDKFVYVYNFLKKNCGNVFGSSAEFYCARRKDIEINAKQFIFCTEVFLELGIFILSSKVLVENKGVKKPLDDSVIYREVDKMIAGGKWKA